MKIITMQLHPASLFIIVCGYAACVECAIFSTGEEDEFVRIHNEKRLQPQSSNMEYMVWDDDLAYSASVWSEGCVWEHGKPDVDIPYTKYGQALGYSINLLKYKWSLTSVDLFTVQGYFTRHMIPVKSFYFAILQLQSHQNLYIQSGVSNRKREEPSSKEVIENWYSEIDAYRFTPNSCQSGEVCGHYTQIVWATSSRVGCGYAHCEEVQGLRMRDTWFVTCNYYPPGNYRGRQPYKAGKRCSDCPGHDSCFNNLCRNCSDSTAPTCASYQNPDHGITLHYQGTLSSWESLEPSVTEDLKDLVNNFCSKETSTICCPNKSPSSNEIWTPFSEFDIYTRSKYDNVTMSDAFDVILVPVLPNATQVTCSQMYLPNGVLAEATNTTNIKERWSDDNANLVAYDFGTSSSAIALSLSYTTLFLVAIIFLANSQNN